MPRSRADVKSFPGLVSHYRKYVMDFAELTQRFTLLMKKGSVTGMDAGMPTGNRFPQATTHLGISVH